MLLVSGILDWGAGPERVLTGQRGRRAASAIKRVASTEDRGSHTPRGDRYLGAPRSPPAPCSTGHLTRLPCGDRCDPRWASDGTCGSVPTVLSPLVFQAPVLSCPQCRGRWGRGLCGLQAGVREAEPAVWRPGQASCPLPISSCLLATRCGHHPARAVPPPRPRRVTGPARAPPQTPCGGPWVRPACGRRCRGAGQQAARREGCLCQCLLPCWFPLPAVGSSVGELSGHLLAHPGASLFSRLGGSEEQTGWPGALLQAQGEGQPARLLPGGLRGRASVGPLLLPTGP